jgi:hypothetical protein
MQEGGVRNWVNAPAAGPGYREIPVRRETLRRVHKEPILTNINSILDAFEAANSVGTIMDRDYKSVMEGVKNKIVGAESSVKEQVTPAHDGKQVLVDVQAILDEIRDYFETFAEVLASNGSPNSEELQAKDLAEECAKLVIEPLMKMDALKEQISWVGSLLTEIDTLATEVIGMSSNAIAQIQTLTDLINALATE